MTNTVPTPPPYKGQNDQFPLISIQSPFCEKLENYNNLGGVVKVRQGYDRYKAITGTNPSIRAINTYYTSTAEQLYALVFDNVTGLTWYSITGAATSVHTLAGATSTKFNTLEFNNYLFYFGNGPLSTSSTGPQQYTGSAWGTSTYSWPSSFNPIGGCVFKNRAYFVQEDACAYGYSGIDAISGVVTKVDLSSVVDNKSSLLMIRPIAMTENITADTVLAFIFSNGEVLVYSGSYPDSSNWALISRFTISKPLSHRSYIEAQGDSFIMTYSEILSLRNLFIKGYSKEKNDGIGSAIENLWKRFSPNLPVAAYVSGTYDQKNDRLIILLPNYITSAGAISLTKRFTQFVYDFVLEAWYVYYITTTGGAATPYASCVFNQSVYIGGSGGGFSDAAVVMKLEGNSNFMDDSPEDGTASAIAYDLITAPLPISKYGAHSIEGVEVICKSDLYPQTNYKFIADLGRTESASQTLPAQGTGIAKPMMNVGIQGAMAVQLEISGSSVSATIGLELYAFNIWYNSGQKGSR